MRLAIHNEESRSLRKLLTHDRPISWVIVIVLAGAAFWFVLKTPLTGDWSATFHEAAQHPLSPYDNSHHFVYPPWLTLVLWPFSLFEVALARALFAAASVMALAYAFQRLGGGFHGFLMTLLTPMVVTVLVRGETDAIPLLGLSMALSCGFTSQFLGIILLAVKPQTLGLVIPYIIWTSAHRWTLILALLLFAGTTLLVFGWWPAAIWVRLPDLYRAADLSIWPYGLPIGIFVLYQALKQKRVEYVVLTTYFFTPYLNWYSLNNEKFPLQQVFTEWTRWITSQTPEEKLYLLVDETK